MFSSVSICRYDSSSFARSRSPLRSSEETPPAHGDLLRDWFQNPVDGSNHLLPTLCVRVQLLSSGWSQAVILRFAVVLRSAPERCNPPTILETMQCGVERPMLDLENIF